LRKEPWPEHPFSTLKEEKESNYALKAQSKEDFVRVVTDGLDAPPSYFSINARINKEGYDSLEEVLDNGLRHSTWQALKNGSPKKMPFCWIPAHRIVFVAGFIPGAISIGLDGRFAEWAGSLLPFDKPIVLVTAPGEERKASSAWPGSGSTR
jgi:hydroxyacylglutathione hydrolase